MHPPIRPKSKFSTLAHVVIAFSLTLSVATAAPDMNRPTPTPKETRDLQGRPAPAFALETPAGDDVTLAGETGNVIVLHFWATWCGPCHESMPVIDVVCIDKRYLGRGLKVFAVNRKEDEAKIAGFTGGLKLTVPVLMDESDATAAKYLVAAMPATVVIGRDGRIITAFIGVGDDFDARLRESIDVALAASTQPATDATELPPANPSQRKQ